MLKNKIIIAGIVLLGIAALIFNTLGRWRIKNTNSRGTNIICFGDSITFGHGAKPGEDYPSLLAKMTRFPVVNAGIDNDTTEEGLKRIDADILSRSPLLVVIEFGGNDFLRKCPLQQTVKNVGEMVDKIQAAGAMVALFDISAGLILGEYRQPYRDIAAEKGAIFIPGALAGIFSNPDLKSDFIHPNALGYKAIVQRVYRSVIPYLNQNAINRDFKKKLSSK
jgi:lysophospholipase L1-like esterase